ncbi:MAG: glycosyltransferase family 4 protein, partial [Thermoplasmata archaeon]
LAGALRKRGFRVTVLVCDGESKTLADGTRIHAIPRLIWPFRDLALWFELRKIDRERNVDFFQVQNDVFVIAALLAKLTGFRITYDAQVVEQDFWSVFEAKSLREIASSKVMPLCEHVLCRLSERVSVLSDHDAGRIVQAHRLPSEKVFVIPLSPRRPKETAISDENPTSRPIVLFLGSYAHRPNADAISLIGKQIRPRVLRQVPDAVFWIVGKGLPIEALRGDGLEVYSDVDEVSGFIDSATVCVAPLRVGSGVRIKLVEYMSRGKPVVAMSPAVEGLSLRPGVDLVVADDVESFAQGVISLLSDSGMRQRLGRSGFERILELTGEEATAGVISAFYAATVGS